VDLRDGGFTDSEFHFTTGPLPLVCYRLHFPPFSFIKAPLSLSWWVASGVKEPSFPAGFFFPLDFPCLPCQSLDCGLLPFTFLFTSSRLVPQSSALIGLRASRALIELSDLQTFSRSGFPSVNLPPFGHVVLVPVVAARLPRARFRLPFRFLLRYLAARSPPLLGVCYGRLLQEKHFPCPLFSHSSSFVLNTFPTVCVQSCPRRMRRSFGFSLLRHRI